MPSRLSPVWMSALVVVIAASCGLTDTVSRGEIVIATEFPTTGAFGAGGRQAEAGVAYALREVGSIRGFKLVHVPYEDSLNGFYDAELGARNFAQIVDDPRVVAVIGPFNSDVARVSIPITNKAELALISPSTTHPCLTRELPACGARPRGFGYTPASLRDQGRPNNYFRIAPRDDLQASAMADLAIDTLRITRVAVWSDTLTIGLMYADTFSKRFEARGGTVVLRQDFEPFVAKDFTPFLRRAKEAGAEAIYTGANPSTGGCAARAQSKGILDVYYLGTDEISSDACIKDAGDQATDRVLRTDDYAVASKDPANRGLIDAFKKAFPQNDDLGAFTFHGYDAARVLIDALGRAIDAAGGKMPTRRQVLDAVQNTKNLKLSTGTYTFDANGDATAPTIAFYQVKNGVWTFFQQSPVAP